MSKTLQQDLEATPPFLPSYPFLLGWQAGGFQKVDLGQLSSHSETDPIPWARPCSPTNSEQGLSEPALRGPGQPLPLWSELWGPGSTTSQLLP